MTEPLFAYQDAGAAYLTQRERGGLHDEPGVGKTGSVIGAIDMLDAQRGIICVPAMLRENWIIEMRRFMKKPRRVCKGMNRHDFYAWLRGRFDILVSSYEQITKWAPHIRASGEILDFFACDEAHALKNGDTNRVKAILGHEADGDGGAIEWAQRVWHVTGTPMVNDPVDIWTFLRLCGVMPLSRNQFIKRYFHKIPSAYGIRTEPKPEMVPELQLLIANNSIRRTKADVGIFLPPIFMTSLFLDGNTDLVVRMLREHPGLEAAIVRAIEQGGLSFLDSQHIMELRRLVGEAKAVPYAYTLLHELRSGETDKRVVFGVHRDALTTVRDILTKYGVRCVLINGDTKERDRIAYVKEFTNDPECKCMIGAIRAAGEGNNFQAACEIDMFESEWSPGKNAQAIFRVHRRGQERKVRARWITLSDSIDVVVNGIVARKTAAIASVEGVAMNGSAPEREVA